MSPASTLRLVACALVVATLATAAACAPEPRDRAGSLEGEGSPAAERSGSVVPTFTPPADPTLALGHALYMRECASCHGERGEGEPDWQVTRPDGSLPAPPHDVSGHTWHHADAELLQIIGEGGTVYMPESNMPGYGDRLSDDEMRALLAWIKTLWGTEERSWQQTRTEEWATMRAPTTPPATATVPSVAPGQPSPARSATEDMSP